MADGWLYVRCLFKVGLLTGLIFAPIVVWIGSRYFDKKENQYVIPTRH